jgi:pimeloyl-ACP methyl ester carboxylesterase
VLLLHGKNFSGLYWEPTVEFLAKQGYRVIVPDQLGFGASSRPDIHYSFHHADAWAPTHFVPPVGCVALILVTPPMVSATRFPSPS